MTSTELLEPVLTGGIANTNFFNGRLLTAEDLRTEQAANRAQHEQLANAVGEGVVYGLEVRLVDGAGSPPMPPALVRVSKGLGLNRNGDAVSLAADTDVALVSVTTTQTTDAGLFAECQPPQAVLTNLGLYILTVMPASGLEGRAPMTELGGSQGIGTSCGSRNVVEGVKFRLQQLDSGVAPATGTLRAQVAQLATQLDTQLVQLATTPTDPLKLQVAKSVSMLRNMAAHLCLGTDTFADFATDPFPRSAGAIPGAQYGAVDDLRARKLISGCEVPVALLYWGRRGVEFVDWWAVRRSVAAVTPSDVWTPLLSDRRTAETIAAFLQFQHQLADVRRSALSSSMLGGIHAAEWLRFLPPCGFVPLSDYGAARGFALATFFMGFSAGEVTDIQAAKLRKVVSDALLHPPVDLSSADVLQLYRVRAGASSPTYTVFVARETHGILEHDAVARTFQDAWDVYRGLIKRRLFLPMDSSSDAAGARVSMVGAVQDVMAIASQVATLAAAQRLNYQDALRAFDALYGVQHDLVTTYQATIPGGVDPQARLNFATTLNTYLETAGVGGILALKPAITQKNLLAAIAAQDAINGFVGGTTGEGVAIGYIEVDYTAAPDGRNLVPTQSFKYAFNVINHTDKGLAINLRASIEGVTTSPPGQLTGDWSRSLDVKKDDGTGHLVSISDVTLVSETSSQVYVVVTVPGDADPTAAPPEQAVVTLSASVLPPHNKTAHADTLPLTVASSAGSSETRTVRIDVTTFPDPPAGIGAGAQVTFAFDLFYFAPAAETGSIGNFKFTLTVLGLAGDDVNRWTVAALGGLPLSNPSAGVYTASVALPANDVARTITINVSAPTTGGIGVTVHARLESTATPPLTPPYQTRAVQVTV